MALIILTLPKEASAHEEWEWFFMKPREQDTAFQNKEVRAAALEYLATLIDGGHY